MEALHQLRPPGLGQLPHLFLELPISEVWASEVSQTVVPSSGAGAWKWG